ncbi:uncharacterized protein I303_105094 [Kwoniella dejecticola CBS 10117]|uniref:Uncharacterized protein n=1 Tax=Kwoniella dejecticola CBS 10117 TaxID=1296121 RepID=A0A1A6A3G8_9TREE|nr:uncharacterized protein I303_05461 [Kwoniella dejecticola CBS 10117]OBR84602.1 hypothetical protein I303_05461 [Kwoniella dejecticola CBS 10117]
MENITSIHISVENPQLLEERRVYFPDLLEGLTLERVFDELGASQASDPRKPFFRVGSVSTEMRGHLARWQDELLRSPQTSAEQDQQVESMDRAFRSPNPNFPIPAAFFDPIPTNRDTSKCSSTSTRVRPMNREPTATAIIKKHLYTTHLWEGFEAELNYTIPTLIDGILQTDMDAKLGKKVVIIQLAYPQHFRHGQWQLEFSRYDDYDDFDQDESLLSIQRDSWFYQQLRHTTFRDSIPTYLGMFHKQFQQYSDPGLRYQTNLFAMMMEYPGEIVDIPPGTLQHYSIDVPILMKCYELFDALHQLRILHNGSLSQVNLFYDKASGRAKLFTLWSLELVDDSETEAVQRYKYSEMVVEANMIKEYRLNTEWRVERKINRTYSTVLQSEEAESNNNYKHLVKPGTLRN